MQAYKRGIHYPKYMLLTYGWYSNGWWKGEATSSQYNCTDEQRASVLLNTLAPLTQEYPLDFEAVAEPGIVSCHQWILSIEFEVTGSLF